MLVVPLWRGKCPKRRFERDNKNAVAQCSGGPKSASTTPCSINLDQRKFKLDDRCNLKVLSTAAFQVNSNSQVLRFLLLGGSVVVSKILRLSEKTQKAQKTAFVCFGWKKLNKLKPMEPPLGGPLLPLLLYRREKSFSPCRCKEFCALIPPST